MQLPAISSLASLLSTSLEDPKAVLKPTSLTAAAYFILVNLVLVFPPLRDAFFSPIMAFESLPTLWQILLGTFILLTLSFILNVLGNSFVDLMSGKSWSDSVPLSMVEQTGIDQQEKGYRKLWEKVVSGSNDSNWDSENAAEKLAYEYPDEVRDLAPTRLGNILLSPASYTYRQYGAQLDTIWPILAVQKKDDELVKQVTIEMEAIVFLCTMSVLSLILAVELLIVLGLYGDALWSFLWVPVMLAAAYVFYRVSFSKAIAWGSVIRNVFDLYLDDASKALKLREDLKDPEAKRKRWREVSGWLSIGALRNRPPAVLALNSGDPLALNTDPSDAPPMQFQDPKWYAPPTAASPVAVEHPEGIKVSIHHEVIEEWPTMPETIDGRSGWRLEGREIIYVISITNPGEDAVKGTSLRLTDPRLPMLPDTVNGELGKGRGSLQSVRLPAAPNSAESLLWFLWPLAAGETQVLRYQVRYEVQVLGGDLKPLKLRLLMRPGIVPSDKVESITMPESRFFRFEPSKGSSLVFQLMNQSQLAPLYDLRGNPLIFDPPEEPNDASGQVPWRAECKPTETVILEWDGRRFWSRLIEFQESEGE